MLKVSFYSYKGGSGRSTTAWNTIERLIYNSDEPDLRPTAEEPFVIVDADLQSAGSTFLYNAYYEFIEDRNEQLPSFQKRITTPSMIDYTDPEARKKFFRSMHPIGDYFSRRGTEKKIENEAVLFMGVNLNIKTTNAVDNIGGEKSEAQKGNFRTNILAPCELLGVKALFFDTPSGTQFWAQNCVLQSDVIVCCMRPTDQFREGTIRQLRSFIEEDGKNREVGRRKYILTPTAVCFDKNKDEDNNPVAPIYQKNGGGVAREYPIYAKEEINKLFGLGGEQKIELREAFANNVVQDMMRPTDAEISMYSGSESEDNADVFGIPEIKRFKWYEECLGNLPELQLDKNDKMGLRRYEHLARAIKRYYNELPAEDE